MQETPIVGLCLQRVPNCVPEVQDAPFTALALVTADHVGLHPNAVCD